MRDPERIDRMLNAIRAYWKSYPDLRLGQIVENAKSFANVSDQSTFHVEDSLVEVGLRAMIKR